MEYLQELFCPTRGTRVRKMINHRPLFFATDYACMHIISLQKIINVHQMENSNSHFQKDSLNKNIRE